MCVEGPGLPHILQSALEINTTAIELQRLLTLLRRKHDTRVNRTSRLPANKTVLPFAA